MVGHALNKCAGVVFALLIRRMVLDNALLRLRLDLSMTVHVLGNVSFLLG